LLSSRSLLSRHPIGFGLGGLGGGYPLSLNLLGCHSLGLGRRSLSHPFSFRLGGLFRCHPFGLNLSGLLMGRLLCRNSISLNLGRPFSR
jgi:hypothetical protein